MPREVLEYSTACQDNSLHMPDLSQEEFEELQSNPSALESWRDAESAEPGAYEHRQGLERAAYAVDRTNPELAYRLRTHAADLAYSLEPDREYASGQLTQSLLHAISELQAAAEANRRSVGQTLAVSELPESWQTPTGPALKNVVGYEDRTNPDDSSACTEDERANWIREFGYGLPTDRTLAMIAALDQPVLEIGAGAGYYAGELRTVNVDVAATDPQTDGYIRGNNWTEVERLDAEEAVLKYPDRALMLIWPATGSEWSGRALQLYLEQGGDTVIFQGETSGDMTGSTKFHHLLETRFNLETKLEVPHFRTDHSAFYIYRRASEEHEYRYSSDTAYSLAKEGLIPQHRLFIEMPEDEAGILSLTARMAENMETVSQYAAGATDGNEAAAEDAWRTISGLAADTAGNYINRLLPHGQPARQHQKLSDEFNQQCWETAPELQQGDQAGNKEKLAGYLRERQQAAKDLVREQTGDPVPKNG